MLAPVSVLIQESEHAILRAWEKLVFAEEHEGEWVGPALREDIPRVLQELARWLATDAMPDTSTRVLEHAMQRLKEGLPLSQLLSECRLLREAIFRIVLDEAGARIRVEELARLNAGLDVVLSRSVEQLVNVRDQRAAEQGPEAERLRSKRENEPRATSQAEAELRAERDFSSAVLDTAGSLVVVFDRERRITRFNHSCERVSGYSAAEAHGRTFDFLIPPEQLPEVQEVWNGLLQGSFPNTHENHWVCKDGTRRLIAWSNTAITGPRGEVQHVIGTGMDITERDRAEAALRASEERFRALVTASSEVLYRMSPDWSEMRQLRSQGFLADTDRPNASWLDEYIHPDDQPQVTAVIREAIRTKSVFHFEHRVRRADGTLGWTLSRAVPVTDDKGEVVEWFGSASDVTERKRAEAGRESLVQALREEDRRKTEFLAVLSHELRNPLTPIRNSLYVLDHAAPGGEQARRAQSIIGRQIDQLSRLVDDLLEVTRLTRNKIELQPVRLDLNELVRRTAEDHRSLFEKADVKLVVEHAPEPVFVRGDSNRLAQVVGNLLHNAAKFTPRGGQTTVSVAIEHSPDRALLRVADTGVGMAPDLLASLFEPFVQAGQGLDRSKGGLGLGLALVKGMVELHGGGVEARSDGRGSGTVIIVRLPLGSPAIAGIAAVAETGRRAPMRVLVIEDNRDAAESLREAVSLGDDEVDVAYNGSDGIRRAREFRPDVVFCDIGLPDMDGYAVARALRADEHLSSIFLVALTGYALPEDVAKAKEAGFHRHVAKPSSMEKIGAALSAAAQHTRPAPAAHSPASS